MYTFILFLLHTLVADHYKLCGGDQHEVTLYTEHTAR